MGGLFFSCCDKEKLDSNDKAQVDIFASVNNTDNTNNTDNIVNNGNNNIVVESDNSFEEFKIDTYKKIKNRSENIDFENLSENHEIQIKDKKYIVIEKNKFNKNIYKVQEQTTTYFMKIAGKVNEFDIIKQNYKKCFEHFIEPVCYNSNKMIGEKCIMILKYNEETNLKEFLENKELTIKMKLDLICYLLKALTKLNSKGIYYSEIQLNEILITKTQQIRLISCEYAIDSIVDEKQIIIYVASIICEILGIGSSLNTFDLKGCQNSILHILTPESKGIIQQHDFRQKLYYCFDVELSKRPNFKQLTKAIEDEIKYRYKF